MQIEGHFFSGETSTKSNMTIHVSNAGEIKLGIQETVVYHVDEVSISPRVGNTTRYIDFPDGSQFETPDNEAIDAIVDQFKPQRLHKLIHRLEAAKQFVAVAVVLLIGVGWFVIEYGVPAISKKVAMALPDETSTYLGQGILETLDKDWLEPSALSVERQAQLLEAFKNLNTNTDKTNIQLVFRKSNIGANAFALPDNTIIITDELIQLTTFDAEIMSVLLHEIGHLKYRHTLRKLIESFSMAIFIMGISGDVSAGSSIIASAPAILITADYSQNMELEADDYALQYMLEHHIDPNYFVTMMQKLEASHTKTYIRCVRNLERNNLSREKCIDKAIKNNSERDSTLFGYLSSHPATDERIERFKNPKKQPKSPLERD